MLTNSILGLAVNLENLVSTLIVTVIFVLLGLIVFTIAFVIIAKSTPFSVRKEIEDDQNIALAIVIAAVILGSALIIAAAIHG